MVALKAALLLEKVALLLKKAALLLEKVALLLKQAALLLEKANQKSPLINYKFVFGVGTFERHFIDRTFIDRTLNRKNHR